MVLFVDQERRLRGIYKDSGKFQNDSSTCCIEVAGEHAWHYLSCKTTGQWRRWQSEQSTASSTRIGGVCGHSPSTKQKSNVYRRRARPAIHESSRRNSTMLGNGINIPRRTGPKPRWYSVGIRSTTPKQRRWLAKETGRYDPHRATFYEKTDPLKSPYDQEEETNIALGPNYRDLVKTYVGKPSCKG